MNKKNNIRSFTPIVIGLEAERAVIYERINQRVEIMINEGLLAEAEKVFPNKNLNALQTVGYRELFDFFEGKITLEFAIEEIKKNTRRFAKRQLTWFKRNETIKWFDYQTNKEEITTFIASKTTAN
jgi:tRNA dimethylallyltransferase